jgi:hypothetical protein
MRDVTSRRRSGLVRALLTLVARVARERAAERREQAALRRAVEELRGSVEAASARQIEHREAMVLLAADLLRRALDEGQGRTVVLDPPQANDNARDRDREPEPEPEDPSTA